MNKIDLGQSLTILANLGVIAGIILLAIELHQNNQLLATEAMGAVFENRIARQDRVMENPVYVATIAKNERNEPLSDEERIVMEAQYARALIAWQREYFLFQQEVIPEDYFRTNLPAFKAALHDREVSISPIDYWEFWKDGADPAYVEFIETCVFSECGEIPR